MRKHYALCDSHLRVLLNVVPGPKSLRKHELDCHMSELIKSLSATIAARKANPIPESYTARLLAEGTGKIAQKVGEEAVEVVVAALEESDERLVSEMADLIYHSLVLLAQRELSWSDVETELARRFK